MGIDSSQRTQLRTKFLIQAEQAVARTLGVSLAAVYAWRELQRYVAVVNTRHSEFAPSVRYPQLGAAKGSGQNLEDIPWKERHTPLLYANLD
jgi:hypothetical protein